MLLCALCCYVLGFIVLVAPVVLKPIIIIIIIISSCVTLLHQLIIITFGGRTKLLLESFGLVKDLSSDNLGIPKLITLSLSFFIIIIIIKFYN